MCKFSIIVPCYRIKDSVGELFRMFSSDEYTDYEVIFVDDCSGDGTYEELEERKAQYGRYKVYQTPKNGGPGVARNHGMRHAEGEYILFCDSDDGFDISALPKIERFTAEHPDADMVIFPHEMGRKDKFSRVDHCRGYGDGCVIRRPDIILGNMAPWAKLYRADIIRDGGLTFPSRMTGEDICFVAGYVTHVKKAYKSDILFYRYIVHEQSLMRRNENDPSRQTTFDVLAPLYHEHFPEVEVIMFARNHLLTKVKQMCASGCSRAELHRWFETENKRYPEWIKKVDIGNQSFYRRLIYRAMYHNRPLMMKAIMRLRRILG